MRIGTNCADEVCVTHLPGSGLKRQEMYDNCVQSPLHASWCFSQMRHGRKDRARFLLAGVLILSMFGSSESLVTPFSPKKQQLTSLKYTVEKTDEASLLAGLFQSLQQAIEKERKSSNRLAKKKKTSKTTTATPLVLEVEEFPHSDAQLKSIQSNAPAILLNSGPGTGKSYALALRIAHLLRTGSCRPEHMVALSFTNRDANSLKARAIEMLFGESGGQTVQSTQIPLEEVRERLWSGTIHQFAKSLIQACNGGKHAVRTLNSKEMKMRADKSLRKMMDRHDSPRIRTIRLLHRDALGDLRQSRGMMLHQVCRCIELWKEAGLLAPPFIPRKGGKQTDIKSSKTLSADVRDNCVEIAMRLGISQNVALLALEIVPDYQELHIKLSTADPADLASIAYYLLLSDHDTLSAMRAKLKHVILDEYQDVSVAQHSLLRLLIRGIVDEEKNALISKGPDRSQQQKSTAPPVLPQSVPSADRKKTNNNVCYEVPKFFCAGDSNQSIYGWRGAAPSLSVEGFRSDYPQGIVVPLETSYRLPRDIWNAASALVGPDEEGRMASVDESVSTFPTSPVAEKRRSVVLTSGCQTLPLLFSEGLSEDPVSTLRIKGLWDAREEAKYIASKIRKRCKERLARCKAALKKMVDQNVIDEVPSATMSDPTEVAVMVRSAAELALVEEALKRAGVPYASIDKREESESSSADSQGSNKVPMKPVVLMTMHRAKGEEFDDVYLAGWTEGVFPHPTSVSLNRVHEERRLAYVAVTRARQQVYITHSHVKRNLHHGPDLQHKYVTEQVEPSRFLYELIPQDQDTAYLGVVSRESANGVPDIHWNRKAGCKDAVASRDLPDYYAKSYATPAGYVRTSNTISLEEGRNIPKYRERNNDKTKETPVVESSNSVTSMESTTDTCQTKQKKNGHLTPDDHAVLLQIVEQSLHAESSNSVTSLESKTETCQKKQKKTGHLTPDDHAVLLQIVEQGLQATLVEHKRGSHKTYGKIFRQILKDTFGISRGSAFVLTDTKRDMKTVSAYALYNAPESRRKQRYLSQCTTPQVGLWVAYLILSSKT